jgi:hypothetical protein
MAQAKKPKAAPRPTPDDKEQFERFVETARKLGAEEVGPAFDEAFRKIVPPRLPAK